MAQTTGLVGKSGKGETVEVNRQDGRRDEVFVNGRGAREIPPGTTLETAFSHCD